jgi:hypothetical protein
VYAPKHRRTIQYLPVQIQYKYSRHTVKIPDSVWASVRLSLVFLPSYPTHEGGSSSRPAHNPPCELLRTNPQWSHPANTLFTTLTVGTLPLGTLTRRRTHLRRRAWPAGNRSRRPAAGATVPHKLYPVAVVPHTHGVRQRLYHMHCVRQRQHFTNCIRYCMYLHTVSDSVCTT